MLKSTLPAIAAALLLGACSPQSSEQEQSASGDQPAATSTVSEESQAAGAPAGDNPLLSKSTLPFQAPPFDKIENEDYLPAYKAGMQQHLAEIEKIANNPEPATFENTLVAMEKAGATLNRTRNAFDAVSSTDATEERQEIKSAIAPLMAAHYDAIYLNKALFQRIKTLYDARANLNLDPESARLLEWYYTDFVHNGALLSDADKATLKDLNEEISTLRTKFEELLLAGTQDGALVVDDKAKLAGLSDAEIAAAAASAKDRGLEGKWVIPLVNTTQQPDLTALENRDVRKQLFENSWNRTAHGGANDTRATIIKIAELRADRAKLLGYPNHAAWKLVDQMAKTPDAVFEFVRGLVPAATAKAGEEAAAIQQLIDQSGGDFELQPWDWNFYAEKVRKAKYDLDQAAIKPYLELDSVLKNGVFYAANQLYGLTFKERTDLPVWNPDVRVFEVFNPDGSTLALFYADYFKRDTKNGGAWMSELVGQSKLLGTIPVVYNSMNIPKPVEGQPALLTFDYVTTMFHEFGHALHGMFADQQYPSLAGTAVARDFVEFPSQFNEHWAMYPSVFAHYAKHYQTGEPMPEELVEKIKQSSTFNQGYALTELLGAALLDMQWHTIGPDQTIEDAGKFGHQALVANHVQMDTVPPRYRSSYFMHIWGHGYSAGYYAYLWTEMLAHDAYAWFEDHGGLSRENGDRFRKMVLSRGNTQDLEEMYRNWRGRAPSIEPMLEARGLADE